MYKYPVRSEEYAMHLKELVTEAIKLRRMGGEDQQRKTPAPTDQDDLDDMAYQYPDDEPDFDFGDAVPPGDEEVDVDFGNDGNESSELAAQLDQPLDTPNLNQAGLGGGAVATPSGSSLERDLANSGQAQDGVDPAAEEGGDAVDSLASTAMEDPNKQGVLRKVDGARLVYKRQTENGSYEELWQYNITRSNAPDSFKRRRAILAGTDIPPNKSTSPDGSQSYEVWTTTNAELVRIRGLQN